MPKSPRLARRAHYPVSASSACSSVSARSHFSRSAIAVNCASVSGVTLKLSCALRPVRWRRCGGRITAGTRFTVKPFASAILRTADNLARDLLAKQPHTVTGPSAEATLSDDAAIGVGYTDVLIETVEPLPPLGPPR